MSFQSQLKKFNKEMLNEVDIEVRKIAFDVDARVTKKTPVKSGRAKANWNVSANKIDNSTTKKTSKTQATLNKGDGLKPIYITNSLPYIFKLEHGSSQQARNPNGMVAVTMAEMASKS